jgi:DNA-directed RNA polymerase subunit D
MVDFKESGDKAIFRFKDTSNTIVNSIRKVVLDEVPTMAIEEVEVVSNESPLYDETIAQRLGLIPLRTDLKSYNFKSECKCGGVGCAMCEVKLVVKQSEPGYVYSASIRSDDPQVVPIDLEIPITKLFGKKKIELNLKAILGTGREHAKWSPAHAYLKEDGKELHLILEPFGQLAAKDIYNKAIEILSDKTDKLKEQL